MDISSKDGLPSQQSRAARGSLPLVIAAETGPSQFSQPAPRTSSVRKARPSTGRLTSPAQERGVVLRGRLTRVIASCCIARLVVLASEDPHRPIVIHIDSSGGSPAEAMSILSTMNGIRCPVVTFCRGEAFGPAAIVAANGLRGYRVAAPSCRFCLRIISPKEAERREIGNAEPLLRLLTEILVKNIHQRQEEVQTQLTTGAQLSAQDALQMGLIDAIASEPIFPQ